MERHRRGHQFPVTAIAGACFCAALMLAAHMRAPTPSADASGVSAPLPESVAEAGLAPSTELGISSQPLEQEAEERLTAYRRESGCSLECAGYLDLYGNAWGCLVQGDGWVEILVIRDVADDTCSVQTIRLSVQE